MQNTNQRFSYPNKNRENREVLPKINPNPPKKIIKITLLVASFIALTSSCVVPPEGNIEKEDGGSGNENTNTPPHEDPGSSKNIIASSITSSTTLGGQFQIDVYSLERVDSDLLRLRLGITNKSGEDFRISQGLSDDNNPYTANAVTLIDTKNQNRHISHKQNNGDCFCLAFEGPIESGETVETWVIFPAPPSDVEAMTITTPLTPPLLDIPVSESSETIESAGLSSPEIFPLTNISDNTEDQTGRTENNEEVSIILSSDVLFETNKSELSPEAQEILDQVAQEINDANSETVKIDGHADNTGSDSVNLSLSQDRAATVESALSELVAREGIEFEVQGHGSSDPIADNNTEEGRERNRRVSVTFAKQ
ncbi:OmpA family protein [Nocardiopsis sp. N85]|uniref:OmpA family protein n=1 Tax=Nocardiopsis sp. N85 TaxID=3029400 RepID=UPI00237F27E0|nr:OmpA family protein [Nocardiopsis sp. N85]MDE3719895.1 OmpA family protein [Nocardiopsis sp. N85]